MHMKCEKEKKDRKIKLFVLLFLLILILLGILTGIILIQRGRCGKSRTELPAPTENTGGGIGLVIDGNAESSSTYEHDDISDQGVVIAGWESITISANKKEAEVDFFNPEENAKLYYLTFELRLYSNSSQDYEVLYASGLVEPEKHINQITLSRELEKGVYDAAVHVQPYRINEKTITNYCDYSFHLSYFSCFTGSCRRGHYAGCPGKNR